MLYSHKTLSPFYQKQNPKTSLNRSSFTHKEFAYRSAQITMRILGLTSQSKRTSHQQLLSSTDNAPTFRRHKSKTKRSKSDTKARYEYLFTEVASSDVEPPTRRPAIRINKPSSKHFLFDIFCNQIAKSKLLSNRITQH